MNTILILIKKDLLRDYKRPWGILILFSIPILMATLIALVFGGGGEIEKKIILRVAVLDQDRSFFSSMMRSMASQGDANRQLQFQVVDKLEDGLKLLENHKASALLVFPKNLTQHLIDDEPVMVQFYGNPAEYVLPKVIEQGTEILAVGISQAKQLLGPQIKSLSILFDGEISVTKWGIAMEVYQGLQRLENVSKYLFPPKLTYETIAAEDYVPSVSRTVAMGDADRKAP